MTKQASQEVSKVAKPKTTKSTKLTKEEKTKVLEFLDLLSSFKMDECLANAGIDAKKLKDLSKFISTQEGWNLSTNGAWKSEDFPTRTINKIFVPRFHQSDSLEMKDRKELERLRSIRRKALQTVEKNRDEYLQELFVNSEYFELRNSLKIGERKATKADYEKDSIFLEDLARFQSLEYKYIMNEDRFNEYQEARSILLNSEIDKKIENLLKKAFQNLDCHTSKKNGVESNCYFHRTNERKRKPLFGEFQIANFGMSVGSYEIRPGDIEPMVFEEEVLEDGRIMRWEKVD